MFARFRFHLCFVAFALVAGVLQLGGCSSQESFASLNLETQYVGIQSCIGCHEDVYETYRHTGMGRSVYLPLQSEGIERFGPQVVVCDEAAPEALRMCYHPFWRNDTLYVLEFRTNPENRQDTVYRRVERLDYVIGSGTSTRSYLLNRNGYLYEAPITWYVARQLWDLSPGYHDGNNSRWDREIGAECLHCHNGFSGHVPGTVNKFTNVVKGIDCERCHGPGQEHVRRMQAGQEVDVGRETDYSIVNPEKLPIHLQMDVCQQCHLQGVQVPVANHEFRPGMELRSVVQIFLTQNTNQNAFGIASHAARLQQSQCFVQSAGQMACTPCHDPHQNHREQSLAHYTQVCQSCHNPQHERPEFRRVCTEREAVRATVQNQCSQCHMPKGAVSDIPHVGFTDHYIRIIPAVATGTEVALSTPQSTGQQQYLPTLRCATDTAPPNGIFAAAQLLFYELLDARPQVLQPALAFRSQLPPMYAARLAFTQREFTLAEQLVAEAQAEAETLLPDQRAWLSILQAQIWQAQGKQAQALAAFIQIWESNPAQTEAALQAALLELQLAPGNPVALSKAKKWLSEAIAQKPFDKRLHLNLGFVLLNQSDYGTAEHHLLKALALDPDYAQCLENLVLLSVRQRKAAPARQFLLRLQQAEPNWPNLAALQSEVNRLR